MALQPCINRPCGARQRFIGIVINNDGCRFLKFAVTYAKRVND
jgi:hypothetical protein